MLRRFEGEWNLTPLAANACKIEFVLRYDFENAIARSEQRFGSGGRIQQEMNTRFTLVPGE